MVNEMGVIHSPQILALLVRITPVAPFLGLSADKMTFHFFDDSKEEYLATFKGQLESVQ